MNHGKMLADSFKALDEYRKQKLGAGKMNTQTINTIMTYVVRMQKTVIIVAPGYGHQYIEWNNEYAEPHVMYPSMGGGAVECGIVGIIAWLRNLPEGTEYHLYKPTNLEA